MQSALAQEPAHLVGRELCDTIVVEHRLRYEIGIVESIMRLFGNFPAHAPDLEFPIDNAARGRPEISAAMIVHLLRSARQTARVRISGRRADNHLHWDELLRNDLAVVHPAVPERDIDTI